MKKKEQLKQPFISYKRALLDGKNSSPASSLERPRSPIDLDDTSNDGSNSVTSPKSLSDRSSVRITPIYYCDNSCKNTNVILSLNKYYTFIM